MKVVLTMAISPNGLIARKNGEEDWLSPDNWEDLLFYAKKFNNIVVSRETHETIKRLYKKYNYDDVEAEYKVLLTRDKNYSAGKNYIVAHSPEEALNFLDSKGISEALLLGGGKLNTVFVKKKLINEIWLTMDPYIIGEGRPFLSPAKFDLPLTLLSCDHLTNGRMIMKYKVNYREN